MRGLGKSDGDTWNIPYDMQPDYIHSPHGPVGIYLDSVTGERTGYIFWINKTKIIEVMIFED